MYEKINDRVELNPQCDCDVPPLPVIMDSANAKANDALLMLQRINHHLFGGEDTVNRDNKSPSCFFDALVLQDVTMMNILDNLKYLMERLGV